MKEPVTPHFKNRIFCLHQNVLPHFMGLQSVLILLQNGTPSPEHGFEFQRQHWVLMVMVSHQKFVREVALDLIQLLARLRTCVLIWVVTLALTFLVISITVLSYSMLLLRL